jgi:D-sedoheptulose 7-phosphate isomerase
MKKKVEEIYHLLFERYPELDFMQSDVAEAFEFLKACYANDGKVLVCGNGGSSADADHIVGELMKGFMLGRVMDEDFFEKMDALYGEDGVEITKSLQKSLPAISLSAHAALVTAYINDVKPDCVFAQQVYGYGQEKDVLIAISTSGNSGNILNAIKVAKAKGMKVIGLTGRDGGAMKELCDVTLIAQQQETYKIQELHLPIYHVLCAMVEEEFFGN